MRLPERLRRLLAPRRPPAAAARALLGDDTPPPAPLELIVPATRTLALVADVPRGFSDARLREHLPLWLEELWQGGEAPAIALGPRLADGRRVVFAADLGAVDADLERCRGAGGRPLRLRPAAELLPAAADLVHVSLDAALGRCARHGQHGFLALDAATPPLVLRLYLAGRHDPAARPRELVLLGDDEADLDAWSAALGLPCRRQRDWRWPAAATPPFADFLDDRRLQRHAAGRAAAGRGRELSRLRPAAAALLAAALLAAAGEALYARRLADAQRALQAAMASDFRRAFPEQATVVDPLRQARRLVDELRAGRGDADGPGALLAAGSEALAALAPASVERIVWRGEQLRIRLAGEHAADAGKIAAAMREGSPLAVRAEGGDLLIGGRQ